MSLVAMAAAKAAPGVTTSAVALAGVWPADHGRQVLLAECDPGGGDLAARFGLAAEPGLVSLAAAARRELGAAMVAEHAQTLPGGLRVLLGPAGAEQAVAALSMLASGAVATLDRLDEIDVVADLGRLDPGSPALPLARAASLLLLVVRPRLAELQHLAHLVAWLRQQCRALGLVLVGSGPYPADEIAGALGAEVVGALPADRRAAALLASRTAGVAALRRTSLVRGARSLAEAVVPRLAAWSPAPPSGVEPSQVAPAVLHGGLSPVLPSSGTAPEAGA